VSAPASIAIVGASLAGLRAAETLRRSGFDGSLTLIGDEPHAPYDRPPLSKQFLSGEWDHTRLALIAPEKLAELHLDLRLGTRATGLDVGERAVTTSPTTIEASSAGDERVVADGILIATGARARTLPYAERPGLHVLRSRDDAELLHQALASGPRHVVVVGAGFIGAEVAATARQMGATVSMVELAEAPMIRGLGIDLGLFCAEVHRERGVDVRLGVGVDQILGDAAVTGVVLTDGSEITADIVVVGVGAVPNTEWLEGSGLALDNGVVCDDTCLAAPGIVAAGDVARWHNRLFDEVMRVEHWDNAVEQGMYAARRLLAQEAPEPFTPVPWFWSDQFDHKIQLAGRRADGDQTLTVTGSREDRKFASIFGRDGRIMAVFGFNRPRHVMKFRRLIAAGGSWDQARELADEMG